MLCCHFCKSAAVISRCAFCTPMLYFAFSTLMKLHSSTRWFLIKCWYMVLYGTRATVVQRAPEHDILITLCILREKAATAAKVRSPDLCVVLLKCHKDKEANTIGYWQIPEASLNDESDVISVWLPSWFSRMDDARAVLQAANGGRPSDEECGPQVSACMLSLVESHDFISILMSSRLLTATHEAHLQWPDTDWTSINTNKKRCVCKNENITWPACLWCPVVPRVIVLSFLFVAMSFAQHSK